MNKKEYINRVPIEKNNISIYRDLRKCTNCGACKAVCNTKMGVYGHYDMDLAKEAICINCGQCSLVCPNDSIKEVSCYKKIIKDIENNETVIVQIAPATRFLIGDLFDYAPGKNVIGKLITALKRLGFSYVVDTSFGADITIWEEANEFIERFNNNKHLPLMTSCCPAWVKYVNTFYPEYVDNLSTVKSPILITGSIIKNYYAKKNNLGKVKVVAVVPCTAKKYEITKSDDVDYAITVRELAKWIKESGINFRKLSSSRFDDFNGTASGIIFGTSGGVMEAMIRYVYHKLTYNNPPKKLLNFKALRGMEEVKEATLKIKDREIKIAVVSGTANVSKILDNIMDYDIIEVMACPGGCLNGGGGPKKYRITTSNKNIRSKAIYNKGKTLKRQSSYENPIVKKIYKELKIKPNDSLAHKLLHVRMDNDE